MWLHFCWQSIHGLSHLAQDTVHLGLGTYLSQWTLEWTIGNLREEIKQPSNPYANMVNCSLHRSQLSTLRAILPNLEPDAPGLPWGAVDLGDSYVLLRAWDRACVTFNRRCAAAFQLFLISECRPKAVQGDWQLWYIQWACLWLPNMQIARSIWKETSHASNAEHSCCSHNVKVSWSDLYQHRLTIL